MVKKLDTGKYICAICGKEWSRDTYAISCEQSHEMIYVPISRDDLFKLMMFIRTKDESLITESLWKVLNKYSRGKV